MGYWYYRRYEPERGESAIGLLMLTGPCFIMFVVMAYLATFFIYDPDKAYGLKKEITDRDIDILDNHRFFTFFGSPVLLGVLYLYLNWTDLISLEQMIATMNMLPAKWIIDNSKGLILTFYLFPIVLLLLQAASFFAMFHVFIKFNRRHRNGISLYSVNGQYCIFPLTTWDIKIFSTLPLFIGAIVFKAIMLWFNFDFTQIFGVLYGNVLDAFCGLVIVYLAIYSHFYLWDRARYKLARYIMINFPSLLAK